MLPLSLGVPLAAVSFIGFAINVYILLVLVLMKQPSPNNILLAHLSITQTLVSLLFLVFSFPLIAHMGSWIASIKSACEMQGFLFTILHPLSLWAICGLNCDRFYAISAPLHYNAIVTNRKVTIGLFSGWVVILLLSIPPFIKIAPFKFSTSLSTCLPNFAVPNSLWYAVIFTIATLLIPGLVIVGCNIKVLMIARYHRHRIAAAIYEVTLSAQVTITHQRNPFFVPTITAPSAGGPKFRSRSPISSVLQLVGSFVVLYLPYYISFLWDSIVVAIYGGNVPDQYKPNSYVVITSVVLLTCSTIVNGILYGLKSKTIRKSFQNYWRKKRTKNEIDHEIQARTPSTCGSRRPSMSNLDFLTRPLLQRQLSESFIDINRDTNRVRIKQVASDLSWRPISLKFTDLETSTLTHRKDIITHTASCNTLQVPNTDEDHTLYNSVRNSAKVEVPEIQTNSFQFDTKFNIPSVNPILQKVLRLDHNGKSKKFTIKGNDSSSSYSCNSNTSSVLNSSLKSPKILITEALSDEIETITNPSLPNLSAKENLRKEFSSSSIIVEGDKWYAHHQNEISSYSTTGSEISQRRCSSLDENSIYSRDIEIDSAAEQELLLSWPITRKEIANKEKKYSIKRRNVVLCPNPLFNDRFDEIDIAL